MAFLISNPSEISETEVSILAEGARLEGKIHFSNINRVHGELFGEITCSPNSVLLLGETSVVEGKIAADTLVVDGYVKGEITATTKVTLSKTARVQGNIRSPKFEVEFGAFFEGEAIVKPN